MLLRHLNKPLFSSDNDSNLKSWSSSLIFVIRYAVWRAAKRGVAVSEVQFCIVDTTKFPPAQFLRDRWLLQAYKDLPMTRHDNEFVDLRLNEAYNNGEFLSQRRVDVAGRSAVFTLADLERHGLSELYPELFATPSQNGGWTKRAKTLRSEWSKLCLTPRKDIDNALRVADLCFAAAFDQTEIVLLLMAFKERWLNGTYPVVLEYRACFVLPSGRLTISSLLPSFEVEYLRPGPANGISVGPMHPCLVLGNSSGRCRMGPTDVGLDPVYMIHPA
jgi:hypothetical protein